MAGWLPHSRCRPSMVIMTVRANYLFFLLRLPCTWRSFGNCFRIVLRPVKFWVSMQVSVTSWTLRLPNFHLTRSAAQAFCRNGSRTGNQLLPGIMFRQTLLYTRVVLSGCIAIRCWHRLYKNGCMHILHAVGFLRFGTLPYGPV